MAEQLYDLVIIGAGSGGLIAADFAVQLGAKVALVEKERIGGDCTWTGCVPSKSLLKAAKIAHDIRSAAAYGIKAPLPEADMGAVREYVRAAIAHIYQGTTPEALQRKGMDVHCGAARFLDSSSIDAGGKTIRARKFLITTGARPAIPPIAGLSDVPFVTYLNIFDNDRMPGSLVVIGGGPIGAEMAQAYRRLGSQVTIVTDRFLSKEDSDVRKLMQQVFEREDIRFLWRRATAARKDGESIVISGGEEEVRGDLLLVASGRKPSVEGLDLEKAGVKYTAKGIQVDNRLRTTARNIYAAGDVTGGYQFSHFAGWQAFQAVRNALLPGHNSGLTDLVPRVTFTDPEVAHVGPTEEQARAHLGQSVQIRSRDLRHVDRAVCENDREGFIKVMVRADGSLLGATIVAQRAGETITELVVAIKHKLKIDDVAGTIHAYPTYSTGIQLLLTEMAVDRTLSGTSGRVVRSLSRLAR